MSFQTNEVQELIGYEFKQQELLTQAFCHKSYNKENPEQPHNEKLEFLGDAVLDLVVSDLLMKRFVDDKEGSLSRKRASVVNEERLSQLAIDKKMDRYLLVGEREENNCLHENPRILASVFEAVVGAIYEDSGYGKAFEWAEEIFSPLIEQAYEEHDFESDYKTRFQEWVQEEYKQTPRYELIGQKGPDHERIFTIEVFVGDESWGKAEGSSKKSAAQNAAHQALKKVNK